MRTISYSELATALRCSAQWDFRYGGRLAGSALRPRATAPLLIAGRAWGRAMAVWHAQQLSPEAAAAAHETLDAEYRAETDDLMDECQKLHRVLDHYVATGASLAHLDRIEEEIVVALPSERGARPSNRWRYQAFLDGYVVIEGLPWLVEFKLRRKLTPVAIVEKQPQLRWYAWAFARRYGINGAIGIMVDETLAEPPEKARLLRDRRGGVTVSHAKTQWTTAESYLEACAAHGVQPNPDTEAALRARHWHQRVSILFSPEDLETVGRELRSGAVLIRDLDNGRLYPIRNGGSLCRWCEFAPVCSDPSEWLIETMFDRCPPKRLRADKED